MAAYESLVVFRFPNCGPLTPFNVLTFSDFLFLPLTFVSFGSVEMPYAALVK